LLITLLNLVRTKITALLLGPSGVGVISVIDQTVALLMQVSSVSLPLAATKFLSEARSAGNATFARSYHAFLKGIVVSLLLGMGAGVAVATLRPEWFGAELSPYRGYLTIALLAMPGTALSLFLRNVLAARGAYHGSALVWTIASLALAALTWSGIRLAGIAGFYWVNVIVWTTLAAGTAVYLRVHEKLVAEKDGFSIVAEIRRRPAIVSFCSIIYVLSFTHPLAFLVARYTVFSRLGEAETGYLQAVYGIALGISMVLANANYLYLTPTLNQKIPAEEKIRTALRFQRAVALLLAPAIMGVVLFPGEVLYLLFSREFIQVSPYLFAFVLSEGLLLLAGVYQTLLVGFDDLKAYFVVCLSAHASIALVSLWLVPHFGIAGVLIGFLGAGILIFSLSLARLVASHGLRVPVHLAGLMSYILVAVGAVGAFVARGVEFTVTTVGARLALYALFLGTLWFFLDRREKQTVRDLAANWLGVGPR
jgi:O-antigen/teichoic acid export membrane protein